MIARFTGLVIAFVLFSCLAKAQTGGTYAVFSAGRESSGTSEKITIQQPSLASSPRLVRLTSAWVYCSTGCDVTQIKNATAATATALTPVALNPVEAPTPKALAYHTSDITGGTQLPIKVTVPAGGDRTLNLSRIVMTQAGTSNNFTIAVTSSTSGTIRVFVTWEEF